MFKFSAELTPGFHQGYPNVCILYYCSSLPHCLFYTAIFTFSSELEAATSQK
uniref:Uncharacterized protein n=1 Tax=Anguilla anguilla TaxID=7936 RepID=A0A0E9VW56_ANGAN